MELLANIFQTDENELMVAKVCVKTLEKRERLTGRCQEKNNRIHSQSSVSVPLSVFLMSIVIVEHLWHKPSRIQYFKTHILAHTTLCASSD